MDIFNVLSLLGGLALFLYGMNVMGDGLAKTAGGRLEKILEKLTSTPVRGVILGAAVTAVIQSSSATTVMVVGFVNSGIMKLRQAVGIIMGANIGTTITSWILSLSGIQSDNIWIKLLKPSAFSPILAVIGIICILFSKSEKKHDAGSILLGFTILMFGMEMMSDAVAPLADVPEFISVFTMFSNPVLGMIAGAVLTAVIQSSSASVGILQALCATGAVHYSAAIPIIMGQNIGTCVTALISSIGAKKNAKRAAFVHLYFNIIGTILFMTVFYTINAIARFPFIDTAANAAGIAVVHTLFNIVSTLCLLPFHKGLEKLAVVTVREKDGQPDETAGIDFLKRLDVRFLEKPAFAVAQSVDVIKQMAKLCEESLSKAVSLLGDYKAEIREEVLQIENVVDRYEDELGTYLVRLSSRELSVSDSQKVSLELHIMGDFERISDQAIEIADIYKKLDKAAEGFSDKAIEEFRVYTKALNDIVNMTVISFIEEDIKAAERVGVMCQDIKKLSAVIKKHHIKRLQKGKCNVKHGIALENLINHYIHVTEHCYNIAEAMLQIEI